MSHVASRTDAQAGNRDPATPPTRFDERRTGEVLQFSSALRVVVAWHRDEVAPTLRGMDVAVVAHGTGPAHA